MTDDREAEWLLSRAYLQQGRMAEASQALHAPARTVPSIA